MKIKIDNHKTISADKLMKKINRPKNDLFYTKSIFNSIVAVVKNAFVKKQIQLKSNSSSLMFLKLN